MRCSFDTPAKIWKTFTKSRDLGHRTSQHNVLVPKHFVCTSYNFIAYLLITGAQVSHDPADEISHVRARRDVPALPNQILCRFKW